MNYEKLKPGQKVFFVGELKPMELISRSKRYAVVVRNIDIEADYDLIYFQVERGAYLSVESAFEDIKNSPIYSLIDFKEEKKAPSNLIFNDYDFWSKKDCEQVIKDLEAGEVELSRRNENILLIDWKRTK